MYAPFLNSIESLEKQQEQPSISGGKVEKVSMDNTLSSVILSTVCVAVLLELFCSQANKNVSETAVKKVERNLLLNVIVVLFCRLVNLSKTFCSYAQVAFPKRRTPNIGKNWIKSQNLNVR
jgi:hypothetical protein